MLKLCNGIGLRVSEIVAIKIKDIDSERMQVFIERAKGKKDRYVNLPESILLQMRDYVKEFKPKIYLFEGQFGGPIVWVHGTGSNCYEATLFADSLAKNGYFIIAIDYYGHGKTPFPTNEVSIFSVADDIYFLLNKPNNAKP